MRFLQTHNQGLCQLLLTSAPSAPHLTVSLYLCSSGSNARGESRAREGRRVSSKSPSRVRDGDEGVAGRKGREKYFSDKGSLICPPGKSMMFYTKSKLRKIESVARPVARLRRAEELEPSMTGLVEGRSSAFSLWSLGGRRQKSRGLDCDPCSQPHPQPGGCNEPGFPTK